MITFSSLEPFALSSLLLAAVLGKLGKLGKPKECLINMQYLGGKILKTVTILFLRTVYRQWIHSIHSLTPDEVHHWMQSHVITCYRHLGSTEADTLQKFRSLVNNDLQNIIMYHENGVNRRQPRSCDSATKRSRDWSKLTKSVCLTHFTCAFL